jgi:hypothetical protein
MVPSPASTSGRRKENEFFERSATPLFDVEEYSPSECSSLSVSAKKRKNPPKGKKGGGGRKGEPRREQNMVAQKRYRNKRVNTANLVSTPQLPQAP